MTVYTKARGDSVFSSVIYRTPLTRGSIELSGLGLVCVYIINLKIKRHYCADNIEHKN